MLAQGGVAASLGPDDDLALHLADTLEAGDGLCDAAVARAILAAAPAAIEDLVRLGAPFDRDAGRAARCSALRRRIPAGASSMPAATAAGAKSCAPWSRPRAGRLRSRCLRASPRADSSSRGRGHRAHRRRGQRSHRSSPATAWSSPPAASAGSISHGTNPAGSFGEGLAIAARAGALMGDLEFVQFHPTALDSGASPLKLISETVRGEGAILIDERGRTIHGRCRRRRTRAARCRRARGPCASCAAGHRVFLDARKAVGAGFAQRFPAIAGFCHAAGIDPAAQPIPVRPAAHYHMGGIEVDLAGRSSLDGLWACGEAACTGLHGANRLASNSLLEAVVCGGLVAASVAGASPPRRRKLVAELPALRPADPAPVRAIMSRAVGVLRDGEGLREAAAALYALAGGESAASDAGRRRPHDRDRRAAARGEPGRACAHRFSGRRGEGRAGDLAPFRGDADGAGICAGPRRLSVSRATRGWRRMAQRR